MVSELSVVALDEEGRPLAKEYLQTLYFSDLDYTPFANRALEVTLSDGRISLIPPSRPFQAAMVVPVKGFGSVYLYADNAGEGLTGREGTIDFVYEAARTRPSRVSGWIQEQKGFVASTAVMEQLKRAEQLLDEAQPTGTGGSEPSATALRSLQESLWAGEAVVLEKARQDIARTGWREGFLFGCSLREPPCPRKDDLFAALLNYATVMLHWTRSEPHQGERDWEAKKDPLVGWLKDNGITVKGHPLLWLHPLGVPDWIQRTCPNYETLKVLLRGFANELVKRYGDSIYVWDVINEAHDWANIFGYSQDQLLDLTNLACQVAREANPYAIRVVNSTSLFGEYVAEGVVNSGKSPRPLMTPHKYLESCVKANIPFEVIGLELYNPAYDMFEIGLLLERFSRFGKPLHLTEIGVPSATVPTELDPKADARKGSPYWHQFTNEWHGPWDEDLQADWLEHFYTLCYSRPYVTAVTNWEFDDLVAERELVHHSGLLRSDLTPKRSYSRLKNLIASFRDGTCIA